MSIHPSLKVDSAGAQHKTVLSRIQRIKDLMKRGKWQDEQDVTALPKTKIIKVKARKVKAEEKSDEEKKKDEKTAK